VTELAHPLNKTMDRADLETPAAREVVEELDRLVRWLQREQLPVSSWYGTFDFSKHPWERVNRGRRYRPLPGAADDRHLPWFLYWEIAWVVTHNSFQPGDRLLDLGGSSSLFSYYLASKGLRVTTVDLEEKLVANADRVASRTGWKLSNHRMDMRRLDLAGDFDHLTSICVFEHIPISDRVEITARIGELLRPAGSLSLTFDYLNPSRRARISSPEDVQAQFVEPSGLSVRGNARFHDNGERYLLSPFHHPSAWWRGWKPRRIRSGHFRLRDLPRMRLRNDYTFGALFLER
jgi:2-polyprenyl-3-methyl-5-hydroxy-6-metoxy-1,4-benzoquinol methylase